MAYDTSIQPFTDADIVNAYRQLLFRGAVAGTTYQIGTRSITYPGPEVAMKVISWAESRADNADAAGIVLVQYGERV